MASTLRDLKTIEPDQVLLLDAKVGEQIRFWLPEAVFSGYHWYVTEMMGGTVMYTGQSISGQNHYQVNLFATKPGSSRFQLREARPFSPDKAIHHLIVEVGVEP